MPTTSTSRMHKRQGNKSQIQMDFFFKSCQNVHFLELFFMANKKNDFLLPRSQRRTDRFPFFFLPLKRRERRQPRDKSTRLITHLAGDGDMKAYRKCQAFLSGERDVVAVAAQDNCTAEAKSEGNRLECGRLFQSHVIRIIYLTVCRLLVARLAFLV